MRAAVARAEADPAYGGYIVMTVREGDCLLIGDAIVRLKKIKTASKVAFAVKAQRHILVRRFADKVEDDAPQTPEV